MNIIDISWPITNNMTTYKDKKPITITRTKTFPTDGINESTITFDAHTGTHVDAPAHILPQGHTIDRCAPDALIGPCIVLDATEVTEKITNAHLEKFRDLKNQIVLLKTKNSTLSPTEKFNHNFVYLEKTGAQYLAAQNVKAVGFDYLGIERDQLGHDTYRTLLEKNILIIEGLRLAHVDPGNYTLCCLPLNIVNGDAAPARAVLLQEL